MKMKVAVALSLALSAMAPETTRAAMAPKYERLQQIDAALEHLAEIASLLADPINRIDYVGGEIRFIARRCYVPVEIAYESPADPSVGGGGRYVAKVGTARCT